MKPRNEKIFVKVIRAGYIPQLGICGPIPNPIKITRAQAYGMIIAGIKVYQYFPETKYTEELTLQNVFGESNEIKSKNVNKPLDDKGEEVSKPVTPITLTGVEKTNEKKEFEAASIEEVLTIDDVDDNTNNDISNNENDDDSVENDELVSGDDCEPIAESIKSKTYNSNNKKNRNKHK